MVTLTVTEQEKLDAEKARLLKQAETLIKTSVQYQTQVAKKEELDAINKKFYDEVDEKLLAYEIEKEALVGDYPDSRLTESDTIDASNYSGRLYDSASNAIVRIDQVDGKPISNKNDCEVNLGSDLTALCNSFLNGGTSMIGVPPVSTPFNFSESERNSGSASNPLQQELLTQMLSDYSTAKTSYSDNTLEAITAINSNIDILDNVASDVHQAHYDEMIAISGLTDANLNLIKSTIANRATDRTAREVEITSKLQAFYDERFVWISARVDTAQGSLTLKKRLEASKGTIEAQALSAQAQADRINNL